MLLKVDRILSEKIASLGFLCACMVVIDHATVLLAKGCAAWWTVEIVSRGICQIAVPYFFVVSGFFIAAHFEEPGWWRRECAKRLKSLIVPYFIWAVIGSLCLLPFEKELHNGIGALSCLGLNPAGMPFYTPMWYLRSLMCLAIVSPFLLWALKKAGVWALAFWYLLSFVLSRALSGYPEMTNFFGNFLPLKWGFFWFSLGIWLRQHGSENVVRKFGKVWVEWTFAAIGVALVVLSKWMAIAASPYAVAVQRLSIPFLLMGFWNLMPSFRLSIAGYSFPVYLLHMIFTKYCEYLIPADGFILYLTRRSMENMCQAKGYCHMMT